MKIGKDNKYHTQLKCILCGEKFGDFTVGQASNTLPICPECKSSRVKAKVNKK